MTKEGLGGWSEQRLQKRSLRNERSTTRLVSPSELKGAYVVCVRAGTRNRERHRRRTLREGVSSLTE